MYIRRITRFIDLGKDLHHPLEGAGQSCEWPRTGFSQNSDDITQVIHAIVDKHHHQSRQRIEQSLADLKQAQHDHEWMLELAGGVGEEIRQMESAHQSLRIIYRAAGSIMEESVKACLCRLKNYQPSQKLDNLIGNRPKQHEVDCLVGNRAYEIKWRDATTDGDHRSKEIERIRNMLAHGLTPVRLMFFIPHNKSAMAIQQSVRKSYEELGGHYHCGPDAWEHVKKLSGHDLRQILLSSPKIPSRLFAY